MLEEELPNRIWTNAQIKIATDITQDVGLSPMKCVQKQMYRALTKAFLSGECDEATYTADLRKLSNINSDLRRK